MNSFPQMRRARRIHHAQKAQVGFQFITEQVPPVVDERTLTLQVLLIDEELSWFLLWRSRYLFRCGFVRRWQFHRQQRLNEVDCCIKVGLENVCVLLNLEVIFQSAIDGLVVDRLPARFSADGFLNFESPSGAQP